MQSLHEDNPDCRLEFCEQFLVLLEADPEFWNIILWTDEVSSKLNGRVNHQARGMII